MNRLLKSDPEHPLEKLGFAQELAAGLAFCIDVEVQVSSYDASKRDFKAWSSMWSTALMAHTQVTNTPLTAKTQAEWDSQRTFLTMSLAQKNVTQLRTELKDMVKYLSPEHAVALGENQTKGINALTKALALKYLADARIRQQMEDEKTQIDEYNKKANEVAQRREVISELLHDGNEGGESTSQSKPTLRREPSNPEAPVTLASASLLEATASAHVVANHVFRILATEKGLIKSDGGDVCADVGLDTIQITQKKADAPARLFVKPGSPAAAAIKLFYYGRIEASMTDGASFKGQYMNIGNFQVNDFSYNLFLIPFPGTALAASASSCPAWMVPQAPKNQEPTMLIKEKGMIIQVEPISLQRSSPHS
jgi:hypothetical protein